jgi:hypothetical protein
MGEHSARLGVETLQTFGADREQISSFVPLQMSVVLFFQFILFLCSDGVPIDTKLIEITKNGSFRLPVQITF